LNEVIKQRLVGTILLGCLAIIFLPILLDGEGISQPEMNVRIPEAPPFPEPLQILPLRPAIISDTLPDMNEAESLMVSAGSEDSSVEQQAASIVDATPALPMLDARGLPQAWSVRLGLFADAENAQNLLNRLLSQEYRAYIEQVARDQGVLSAVFVGPVLTRDEADVLQRDLVETFELEGIIVDFGISSN
jgi:DedD protein